MCSESKLISIETKNLISVNDLISAMKLFLGTFCHNFIILLYFFPIKNVEIMSKSISIWIKTITQKPFVISKLNNTTAFHEMNLPIEIFRRITIKIPSFRWKHWWMSPTSDLKTHEWNNERSCGR